MPVHPVTAPLRTTLLALSLLFAPGHDNHLAMDGEKRPRQIGSWQNL